MSKRKWKGVLSENIRNLGDALEGKKYTFKKGQLVIVLKRKVYDTENCWTGKYEYHYSDKNGNGLVRLSKLIIKENN